MNFEPPFATVIPQIAENHCTGEAFGHNLSLKP
jgi:hypothetical protein